MKVKLTRNLRISILTLILCALTAYVLLDSFMIERAMCTVSNEPESTENVEGDDAPVGEVTDAYSDSEMSVVLTQYREYDTDIYVADIRIDSPEYLKCALAHDTYGRNIKEKTSAMAKRVDAIVAVNGDYYGAREGGFVVRNGELYRMVPNSKLDALVIYEDGRFETVVGHKTRAAELVENGARHVFSFGPGLLSDGEITVKRGDEVEQSMRSNPRTAIGYIGDGHYVMLVSDGRFDTSEGLSLYQLASFMKRLGVKEAYNLDGGGSSTMYFKGKIVNRPTTDGKKISERSVSDIVYIGY